MNCQGTHVGRAFGKTSAKTFCGAEIGLDSNEQTLRNIEIADQIIRKDIKVLTISERGLFEDSCPRRALPMESGAKHVAKTASLPLERARVLVFLSGYPDEQADEGAIPGSLP